MLLKFLHALVQTDFHIGNRFWAHKNRRTKNLKQSLFICNQNPLFQFVLTFKVFITKSYACLFMKKTNRQTKRALT